MELVGAPLGEDLLSALGEHLREACVHLLRGLGHRTLDVVEDGLGVAEDGGATGDGGGDAPEGPGRVRDRALRLGGGHAPRLAGPAAERWRQHASG